MDFMMLDLLIVWHVQLIVKPAQRHQSVLHAIRILTELWILMVYVLAQMGIIKLLTQTTIPFARLVALNVVNVVEIHILALFVMPL
jgi:hypothetical protein